MTTYVFVGTEVGKTEEEMIQIDVRARDKIFMATSKNNYILEDKTSEFYDNKWELKKCLDMSEREFKDYLEDQFKKLKFAGYELIKVVE